MVMCVMKYVVNSHFESVILMLSVLSGYIERGKDGRKQWVEGDGQTEKD